MEKNSNRIKGDELLVRSEDLTTILGFYKSTRLYGGTMTFRQWNSLLDRQGLQSFNEYQRRACWKDNIERLDKIGLVLKFSDTEVTMDLRLYQNRDV